MRAIAVRRGEAGLQEIEVPKPEPASDEALVRTLRVGIDGTDHEVIEGNHGGFPEGEDFQILGHEAVGVVEDSQGTSFEEGDLVVPTVRRPSTDEMNEYFKRGEPDMAPDEMYLERGILDAHGYMAEYFTALERFLVRIPAEFAADGFLVEPISNSEKAIEHAYAARSAFDWTPETGMVLGNGPLGLLTVALLEQNVDFERTYCLGRRDRPDPTIDIIEELGATYVDSRETPVPEIAEVYEPVDFIYEATGYAPHAFQTVDALAPNGIGALLGIPEDSSFEIDGGRLHREMVLQNKALFGSVNSNLRHFEAATESLAEFPEGFTNALITNVYAPDEVEQAFQKGDDVIRTVVEFNTP